MLEPGDVRRTAHDRCVLTFPLYSQCVVNYKSCLCVVLILMLSL